MNYNEIKKFEIEQIIVSIKRMLSMGFSIEEITRDIEKDTKKMLVNLTAVQLQTNESMKKHRDKEGNVRFRYWNSALLEFIMFDDGVYSYTKSSGFNMAEPEAEFNWEKAEQCIGLKTRKWEDVYEGDILRFPPKNEYEKENFISYEIFFHDNDCANQHIGFQMDRLHFNGSLNGGSKAAYVLPKYISKMEIIGNIHQNKELLDERKSDSK